MSYGTAQEHAAAALTQLITQPAVRDPETGLEAALEPGDRLRLLGLREQLRAAVIERLEVIGRGRFEDNRGTYRLNVEHVGNDGLHLLHRIMRETPHRLYLRDQASPTDLLHTSHTRPDLNTWATAAANITVANHELATAETKPWIHTTAATWHLLADAAETVEAFLVLDHRLAGPGHTNPNHHIDTGPGATADVGVRDTGSTWGPRGQRMIAATIAREARWAGTDHSPDQATSASTLRAGDGVQLVRDLDTLTAAQHRLAAVIHSRVVTDNGYDPDHELTIGLARVLALAQAKTNQALATLAARPGDAAGARERADLSQRFSTRAGQLLAVVDKSARWKDLAPKPVQAYVLAQQNEISHALPRLLRTQAQPNARTVDLATLTGLDTACHTTAFELATTVRRNVTRTNSSYARYDNETGQLVAGVEIRGALPRACFTIIDTPTPASPWAEPLSRQALHQALQSAPTRVGGRPTALIHYLPSNERDH